MIAVWRPSALVWAWAKKKSPASIPDARQKKIPAITDRVEVYLLCVITGVAVAVQIGCS